MQRSSKTRILTRSVAVLLALLCLFLVHRIYEGGNAPLAAAVLGLAGVGFFIYTSRRLYTLRYLFPGLAGIALFVVLPVIYTVGIGFTNYSSRNLLSFERATEALLGELHQGDGAALELALYADGDGYRIVLTSTEEDAGGDAAEPAPSEPAGGSGSGIGIGIGAGGGDTAGSGATGSAAAGSADAGSADAGSADAGSAAAGSADAGSAAAGSADAGSAAAAPEPGGIRFGEPSPDEAPAAPAKPPAVYVTPVLKLGDATKQRIAAVPLGSSGFTPGEPVALKEIVDRREALQAITVTLPDGTSATMTGLREFARAEPLYKRGPDGTLVNQVSGAVLRPNFDTGFYETPDGQQIAPGFRVGIGLSHYGRVFTDDKFRGPFLRIFAWTVLFSALTVVLTVAVGMVLAELLSWEALRFRGVYRVLLFLPYAVPGFISILVFKGLFNANFGEINAILDGLFGIRPNWFGDATLAKLMLLIVNTWLGYPYFMLLCMGLQKSIPRDLYEASALAGAGPLTNFFKITWPLIRKPLTPLMVSSFAFNFNNFVLISLLTRGRPDFLHTTVPAGETDLLVTYTYRIAFEDSGQNFGLAAAISTLIFAIVAVLSIVNLRLTKVTAEEKR